MNAPRGPFSSGPNRPPIADAEIDAVTTAIDDVLAQPVLGVTPIEGRTDASFRVYLPDGSLIATRRDDADELSREAKKLDKLWKSGAPVPRLISRSDSFLFEEDPGGQCLTAVLQTVDHGSRLHLLGQAFASLYKIKLMARKAKLRKPAPFSCADKIWLDDLVASPFVLSEFLEIPAPAIDPAAIIKSLAAPRVEFTKWRATPSDAFLCDDGDILWTGWRNAGLGVRYEDVGHLISDADWSLDPNATLALFRRFQADWTPQLQVQLCIYASLKAVHRLKAISLHSGDDPPIETMMKLVDHAMAYAAHARLLRGAMPWFERLASDEIW